MNDPRVTAIMVTMPLLLLTVAINVSPIQVTQGDLFDDLEDQLVRWNLEAKFLDIEVTVSCLINGLDEAVPTLQEVRDIGIVSHCCQPAAKVG